MLKYHLRCTCLFVTLGKSCLSLGTPGFTPPFFAVNIYSTIVISECLQNRGSMLGLPSGNLLHSY